MIRVLIVDDARTSRSMLEFTVGQMDGYNVVQSLESAQNAIAFCEMTPIDLIIMDIYTAHGESGLEAAKTIKQKHPKIKIIMVTSLPEESFINKARSAGCESFWYKDVEDKELLQVIERTMAGESVYPDSTPTLEIGMAKSVEFSEAEIKTLRAMIEYTTYKDAADHLGISPRTVKAHVSSMLAKTGYHYFTEIAIEVSQKNLIVKGF